ncbi:MAG: hypothetical protein LBV00_03575, partial [Propionibacteriaceae bacterium]|nr:hypothetical protein [Propionibacteriaceae bacterium]
PRSDRRHLEQRPPKPETPPLTDRLRPLTPLGITHLEPEGFSGEVALVGFKSLAAAFCGGLIGASIRTLTFRERDLFKLFKNR